MLAMGESIMASVDESGNDESANDLVESLVALIRAVVRTPVNYSRDEAITDLAKAKSDMVNKIIDVWNV